MICPFQTRVPPTRQPRDRRPFRLSGCGALITAALAGIYAAHLLSGVPAMIAEARACAVECVEVAVARALP